VTTRYAGGPQDSPGYLLWHATLRWQRMIASALAPLDLTHVQFVLLTCLWWLEEQSVEPNQLGLAQQAGTDVKMTSQVLRALEGKGFVERRTDRQDTRAKTVHLTAGGRRLARRAVAVVEATDAEFFAPVMRGGSPDRVAQLLRRISRLEG
jgi:DNA-binding MarR family transcriptional regulator